MEQNTEISPAEHNSGGAKEGKNGSSLTNRAKARKVETIMYSGPFLDRDMNFRSMLTKGAAPGISPSASISKSATVDPTASVGPNAVVGMRAKVQDSAYVDGKVYQNAIIRDTACVDTGAFVTSSVLVQGEARILKGANVTGQAIIFDCATIGGDVYIKGSPRIGGSAVVRGSVLIGGDVVIGGDARIEIKDEYRNLELYVGTFYGDCLIERYHDLIQICHDGIHWTCYRTSREGHYQITCQEDYWLLDGYTTPENPAGGPNYHQVPDLVMQQITAWQEWHRAETKAIAEAEAEEKELLDSIYRQEAEGEPTPEDHEADHEAILRGIAREEQGLI